MVRASPVALPLSWLKWTSSTCIAWSPPISLRLRLALACVSLIEGRSLERARSGRYHTRCNWLEHFEHPSRSLRVVRLIEGMGSGVRVDTSSFRRGNHSGKAPHSASQRTGRSARRTRSPLYKTKQLRLVDDSRGKRLADLPTRFETSSVERFGSSLLHGHDDAARFHPHGFHKKEDAARQLNQRSL